MPSTVPVENAQNGSKPCPVRVDLGGLPLPGTQKGGKDDGQHSSHCHSALSETRACADSSSLDLPTRLSPSVSSFSRPAADGVLRGPLSPHQVPSCFRTTCHLVLTAAPRLRHTPSPSRHHLCGAGAAWSSVGPYFTCVCLCHL